MTVRFCAIYRFQMGVLGLFEHEIYSQVRIVVYTVIKAAYGERLLGSLNPLSHLAC